MAKLILPSLLQKFVSNKNVLDLSGNTVGDVLKSLTKHYPALKEHCFDQNNHLKPFINCYLNKQDIRDLTGNETPVEANDTIVLVCALIGG